MSSRDRRAWVAYFFWSVFFMIAPSVNGEKRWISGEKNEHVLKQSAMVPNCLHAIYDEIKIAWLCKSQTNTLPACVTAMPLGIKAP